jgi:hypothetical protein
MWEAKSGRIAVSSQPRQKSLGNSILMEQSWLFLGTLIIPARMESIKLQDNGSSLTGQK